MTSTSDATLTLPAAVYAAAQLAGLRTVADDQMQAAWTGIHWYHTTHHQRADEYGTYTYSEIHPRRFEAGTWAGWDTLPETVRVALQTMRAVSDRMHAGYGRARPLAGRAMQAADDARRHDEERAERARAVVHTWILTAHPEIVRGRDAIRKATGEEATR